MVGTGNFMRGFPGLPLRQGQGHVAAIGRARVNQGGSAYPPVLPRRVPGRNLPDWLAVPTSGPPPVVDIATIEAVYWWMVHSWDVSDTARHADTEDLRASDLTGQAVGRG